MRIETPAFTTPAFALDPGTLASERALDRVRLTFTAPARRLLDGGFELAGVYLWLTDRDGRLITRKSGDWSQQPLLSNRAVWVHEVLADQLAAAASITYEIDHRFDYRRTVAAGELPPLPVEADGSEWWRWLEPDPRTLTDACQRFDLGLWARSGGLDLTLVVHPRAPFESLRSELELELADADGLVAYSRTLSISSYGETPGAWDASDSMERRALRALHLYKLAGRTEGRLAARFGPLALG
jgi:hypothetical protein